MIVYFKSGDCVELNSGGPKMTVKQEANHNGEVVCAWFDGTKLKQASFATATIKHCKEPKAK